MPPVGFELFILALQHTHVFISNQADDLARQWKLQPKRFLGKLDFDQNSKIQQVEWKAIRAAVREQVLANLKTDHNEHHVMSRSEDKS